MAALLLVEDNPGDVVLTRRALKKTGIKHTLHVAPDGEAALDFLYQRGCYTDAPRPGLILLDLNLPKFSGPEVLAILKADANLRRIPVIVLTSSKAAEDVTRSFDLHCQSYIVKPVDLEKLLEVLEEWWFVLGKIPG